MNRIFMFKGTCDMMCNGCQQTLCKSRGKYLKCSPTRAVNSEENAEPQVHTLTLRIPDRH